ncbi:hypothetical protein [Phenylobacterium sp.]|uniref:hypothetical protein n=1 Tax=Phenylobacterium sp. TaxID=1871053 RepID=UPI002FC7E717
MNCAIDFARLRRSLTLFEGETLLEGWAAERVMSGEGRLGLAIVTNWRLIFIDSEQRLSAIPIAKIDEVAIPSPRRLAIRTWYDRMDLVFDGPAAAVAVLNLLRQDPKYAAREGVPGVMGAKGHSREPTAGSPSHGPCLVRS